MDKETLEKEYEEITDVTFDHEGAHLASTHAIQGGASNGKNTPLLLKAEDTDVELNKALDQVTVTMSMEEYLRTFFNLYYSEAEFLTKLMDMETEDEYYMRMDMEEMMEGMEGMSPEMMMDMEGNMMDMSMMSPHMMYLREKLDKVEILRSAANKDFKDLSSDELNIVKSNLTQFVKGIAQNEEEFKEVIKASKSISSAADVGQKEVTAEAGADVVKTSGDGGEITKTHNVGDSITKEDKNLEVSKVTQKKDVQKSAEAVALEKAQAKIADLEKKAAEAKGAEVALEKAAKRIEALEKAEEARIEKAYANFAKELSYIAEDDKGDLVKALMSIREAEAGMVVYGALEKAQTALTAAIETEAGVEEEAEVTKGKDVLTDLIKARYADKV